MNIHHFYDSFFTQRWLQQQEVEGGGSGNNTNGGQNNDFDDNADDNADEDGMETAYFAQSVWMLFLYLALIVCCMTKWYLMKRMRRDGDALTQSQHNAIELHHNLSLRGREVAEWRPTHNNNAHPSMTHEFYNHKTQEIKKELLTEHFCSHKSELKIQAEHIKGNRRGRNPISKSDSNILSDDRESSCDNKKLDNLQHSSDSEAEEVEEVSNNKRDIEQGYYSETANVLVIPDGNYHQIFNDKQEELDAERRSLATTPGKERCVSNCCAICLEEYEVGDTVVWSTTGTCPHVFHEDCLIGFLERTRSADMPCPCCRQSFCNLTPSEQDLFLALSSPLPPPPS